eukprot:755479-Hanusia_phi.AAC.1
MINELSGLNILFSMKDFLATLPYGTCSPCSIALISFTCNQVTSASHSHPVPHRYSASADCESDERERGSCIGASLTINLTVTVEDEHEVQAPTRESHTTPSLNPRNYRRQERRCVKAGGAGSNRAEPAHLHHPLAREEQLSPRAAAGSFQPPPPATSEEDAGYALGRTSF